ncbi:sugar phosphate isomerase/epimerase family protein [Rhodococcus jostii]|uniref:Sugar phosphate isomerase/epimerase family protein n=1 Tax=Rhodococcus jostii TaxID=132919 RepID=A0ABU4C9P8_RHOJO|nr:sugar phosphate isomerase/epimerase family protein [Rhodococcus jostii]MDV6280097.1 sugar phosphate isomerase/epimerase family protein [Rhodococcus jostii]
MSFTQRYTAHLGYAPPKFRPQLLESVGTTTPTDHVEYAAALGMAGIFDPWALGRDRRELDEIGRALAETGLSSGSIVCVPVDKITAPIWTDRSRSGRSSLARLIREAAEAGQALGSPPLAVLVAADPDRTDIEQQRADVAANLRDMGRLTADFGIGLAVEAMTVLPNMLLRNLTEAVEVVSAADDPGVGIIFDTGHASITDGDLLAALSTAADHLSILQIADMPGRVEPGAGELQLVEVLASALVAGYTGLIDLEHYWADASRDGEQAGLERIRRFDALVDAAVRSQSATSNTQHQ